ncbi:MAG: bifunctional hydroxymethylpyrimidine kinase/phosphomethylpyrimidine kinase [Prevotellaceae bacterium]|jgi:hydroxymethylpyrimidine/phosphomethylpyrimidine kinase|nr:bifunctional hydroxymethylpyrimidine kinase/phosphomethylpyrimidine kinase [Prevotellaceae bacterium]
MNHYPTVLTIAGSDSCGGAGIQADIKTISSLGAYACSAITAITAQNTLGVRSIQGISPSVLKDQIEAVFDDLTIDAVKTGMLYNKVSIEIISECLARFRPRFFVLDPVMISTGGSKLITDDAIEAMQRLLFPLATVVTPNIAEAEVFTGVKISSHGDMQKAAEVMLQKGCHAVLMKGGHLPGNESVDILFEKGKNGQGIRSPFIETKNTHGTGCTLSAAFATYLALGEELREAFVLSKDYIIHALYTGKDAENGKGHGGVNHFFDPQKLKTQPRPNRTNP